MRRDGVRQIEAGHLAVGVDAGVGAAGGAHEHALAGHLVDGVLEVALNGPLPGLALPAGEIGAVVLDDDPAAAGQAQNSSTSPSVQLLSPTCSRPDWPRPEMSEW